MRTISLVLILSNVSPAVSSDKPVTPAEVRDAVGKSLSQLESAGAAWIKERKCVSCHQIPFMLWSQQLARHRDFKLDAKLLDERRRWAWQFALDARDKNKQPNGHGVDTLAHLILGRDRAATDDKSQAALAEMATLLTKLQKADGSWPAGGQLPGQRRPDSETHAATTTWAVLALGSMDLDAELASSRAKGVRFLRSTAAGKSTESVALRLFFETKFGSREKAADLLAELKSRQNEDGGWGWDKGAVSDALATGQSLYLLARLKAREPTMIAKAQAFLVRSQQEDGSWIVPTTKKKTKHPRIPSDWGSAWGAIGLLHSMTSY